MTGRIVVLMAGIAVVTLTIAAIPRAQTSGIVTGIVTGMVVDEQGRPVAAARVTLTGVELRGTRSIVTDQDGRFTLLGLPAGRFTLTAFKPGHARTQYGARRPGGPGTPLVLADGQRLGNATVTLPHGSVITGTILDTDGTPAAAIVVRALRMTLQNGARRLVQVGGDSTDDRGSYRIYQLPPGEYFVSATLPEAADDQPSVHAPVYFPGTADFAGAMGVTLGVAETRRAVDLQLQLQPVVTVAGVVRLPGAEADCPATVAIVPRAPADAPLPPGLDTMDVDDGQFEFAGVAPGTYRLMARCGLPATSRRSPVPLWAALDVTVGPADVRDVVLRLQSGTTVSGRVVFDGSQAPSPAARVRVTMAERGIAARELGGGTHVAEVADDGSFALSGLPPGHYDIEATISSGGAGDWSPASAVVAGRDVLDFPLEVPPNEPVTGVVLRLSDRTQGIIGRLVDPMNQPIAEYTVVAFPVDTRYWIAGSRRIRAVRVARDGTFTIQGLPPGEYRLAPAGDHADTDWEDPALLPPLVPASVRLTVRDGAQTSQPLQVGR